MADRIYTIERVITIPVGVDGDEDEITVDVEFTYTPEEPRAWDYPGYPAEAEVLGVIVKETGVNITPTLSSDMIRAIARDIERGREAP